MKGGGRIKTLILDALPLNNGDYEQIRTVLQNQLQADEYKCEWIDVQELNINLCLRTGCLACQFETAGLCKQKDDMEKVYPKLVQADLLVFLTPVSFGGYHSELKKVVDRFLPLSVPFYTISQREMHFKTRYEELPNLFTIGVVEEETLALGATFSRLTERNALNLHTEEFASVVIERDTTSNIVQTEIKRKLKEVI